MIPSTTEWISLWASVIKPLCRDPICLAIICTKTPSIFTMAARSPCVISKTSPVSMAGRGWLRAWSIHMSTLLFKLLRSTGKVRKSSIPCCSYDVFAAQSICAVMPTIGMRSNMSTRVRFLSISLIFCVASKPLSSGMLMSIRMRSKSPLSNICVASSPSEATCASTPMPLSSQHTSFWLTGWSSATSTRRLCLLSMGGCAAMCSKASPEEHFDGVGSCGRSSVMASMSRDASFLVFTGLEMTCHRSCSLFLILRKDCSWLKGLITSTLMPASPSALRISRSASISSLTCAACTGGSLSTALSSMLRSSSSS
mmetsp:Transcript_12417/g.26528  ORF Transcript_12417/g.26528 Transcript_12417/m.26528 type:complete len:312 (+) Transcript_12417:770-1705(+)